jgi:hypothetical protein
MIRAWKAIILILLLSIVAWSACVPSVPCPYRDGNRATWVGETKIVNGHVFGVYRCPLGHETLVGCD